MLSLHRASVCRRPAFQAPDDLVRQISHDQLGHDSNDSTGPFSLAGEECRVRRSPQDYKEKRERRFVYLAPVWLSTNDDPTYDQRPRLTTND